MPIVMPPVITAVVSDPLKVHVEDGAGLTIEVITLQCGGGCADVIAVARGGHPPYVFSWDDGSPDPKRHVCLSASTKLGVTVTDTVITNVEFGPTMGTASASIDAELLACPDAGMPPIAADAGLSPPAALCVPNASFEGTPGMGVEKTELVPGWTSCDFTPDVGPLRSSLAASDGATYLGAYAGESAGTKLCADLQAGQAVSLSVDVANSVLTGELPLEIWGGSSHCSKEELLWTSPIVSGMETWQHDCATLTPTKAYSYLVLMPSRNGNALPQTEGNPGLGFTPWFTDGYLAVDNIKPVSSCP